MCGCADNTLRIDWVVSKTTQVYNVFRNKKNATFYVFSVVARVFSNIVLNWNLCKTRLKKVKQN